MKSKTNTKKTENGGEVALVQQGVAQTASDFRNAVLLVSLLVNVFFLTSWLVVETTNVYNAQLISYLQR